MKQQHKNLMLQLLVAALLVFLFAAPFVIRTPSHDTRRQQCIASCQDKGKYGTLVQQDGRYSTKPSARDYQCVCQW